MSFPRLARFLLRLGVTYIACYTVVVAGLMLELTVFGAHADKILEVPARYYPDMFSWGRGNMHDFAILTAMVLAVVSLIIRVVRARRRAASR